jgi:predicted glycosyltransferase
VRDAAVAGLRVANAGLAVCAGVAALALVAAAAASGDVVRLGLAALCVSAAVVHATLHVVRREAVAARRAQRADVRAQVAQVARRVDDARQKQSRHEYHQGAALARIEQVLHTVRADVEGQTWAARDERRPLTFSPPDPRLPRVLFVTSNGAGLGHLTRCLAVARHSRDLMSAAVLTLSTAHDVAGRLGYDVDYFASPAVTGEDWTTWHRRFSRRLHAVLAANAVDVVVFDGTWVYRSLTEACERFDVPLVWMRRGTWRPDADRTQADAPLRHCDHVLVPLDVSGDVGPDARAEVRPDGRLDGRPEARLDALCDDRLDDRPDAAVTRCAPITLVDRDGALERADAVRTLGLDPSRRYVLVQVGGGNVGDVSELTGRVVDEVRRHGRGLVPVLVRSPLSAQRDLLDDDVVTLDVVYPLARYLPAFEFAVCGGGYNTVHENLAVGLPAVYVPSTATTTDDQGARVAALVARGLGLAGRTDEELSGSVAAMCTDAVRARVRAGLASSATANGARQAGEAVVALARRRQVVDR